MSNSPQTISKRKVRRAFDRAADSYDDAALLQKEVCSRLLDRLDYIRLAPRMILDAGAGTGEAVAPLMKRYKKSRLIALDLSEQMLARALAHGSLLRRPEPVCADIEQLPFRENCFDLVFSNLTLQWCNDLPLTLQGLLRVLKPGGLLMFTTFGPDTLKELRACWRQLDDAVHVNQFTDMHDVGDGLLQAGFADPVMEAETITVKYRTIDKLMADLRAIGANATAQGGRAGLTTPSMLDGLRQAYDAYRVDDLLPASYEVVYGHAWKPEAGRDNETGLRVDFTTMK
ncbi:MAG: malonyl-ACP O-methyltransferase BioC [Gammaproteobacteria bacterium]|nr:malonyl-ACP O-methyltransferase BioC [Gammaproteobacteria bacterium]